MTNNLWRAYVPWNCNREPLDSFYRPMIVRPTITYRKPCNVPLHYSKRISENIGTHNYKRR